MLGICVDGRDVRGETRYGAFGAHVLLISTAIGDLGVQLHGSYVGGAPADARVAELFVAPAGDVRSSVAGNARDGTARRLRAQPLPL